MPQHIFGYYNFGVLGRAQEVGSSKLNGAMLTDVFVFSPLD
jgi:hypothetical protein